MIKYYTPTLEEFHVGFEYEYLEPVNNQGYVKGEIFSGNDIDDTWSERRYRKLRVKYLDKEGIESFGFNTEDNGECYNKSIGWMIIGIYPWEDINDKPNEYKISVDMNIVFHGIIKNKSELKKLLKQLNIDG